MIPRPSTIGRTIPNIDESLRMNQINLGRRELGKEEGWHYVNDPGEPLFANNFQNYGSGEERLAFRRDNERKIHFKGVIKASGTAAPSGSTIFQLPTGYEPAYISDHQQPILTRQVGSGITPFWWYRAIDITDTGLVQMATLYEVHFLVMDNIILWT